MPISRFLSFLLLLLFTSMCSLHAEPLTLESVEFSVLKGDRLQFQLHFSGAAFEPNVFHTDNPARIALDFPGVSSRLKTKVIPINTGAATAIHVVEASGRTRVVVNLVSMVPYDTRIEGRDVFVSLQKSSALSTGTDVGTSAATGTPSPLSKQTISNIDFRRGPRGEGRILISLTDPNAVVDMQEEGGKVVLNFINTFLPEHLAKRLDVTDFATPIRTIDSRMDGNRTKVTVTPLTRDYDYLSFQTEGLLTLEFRPLTQAEKAADKKKKFRFTGKRLSLNFQDIAVRSVLQILADFTDLNIVASDAVKGNVTLRLNDVPWDQAMDLILKSKGLAMRQEGNIVRVGPAAEINKQEKEELEALAVKEELAPLRTEIIQVNYSTAAEMQALLQGTADTQSETTTGAGRSGETGYFADSQPITTRSGSPSNLGSILSKRGSVNIDLRSNVLIVKDTARNLEAIRRLVNELDKPIRQVLITGRIVVADTDFNKSLGVRFNATKDGFVDSSSTTSSIGGASGPSDFLTDLPAAVGAGAGGAIGLSIIRVGDYLLDLELSALQAEGKGETLSNPRVVTSDQTTATIEQGSEIAFLNTTSQNGTTTQFKKAVVKLEVTPHITPDDNVIMDLVVTKDNPTANIAGSIDTKEVRTKVMVANGETVVLGGIFESTSTFNLNKVPFFGDLPLIGFLFRKTDDVDKKSELLIFITPKILPEGTQSL